MNVAVRISCFGVLVATAVSTTPAQDSRRSLDLGANNAGISIGDSREWSGIRINFRDTRLVRASGVNLTVWSPTKGGEGDINGFALGVLTTGGANIRGISVAPLGTGARDEFAGIGIGGLGVGAGTNAKGILVGGIGVGGGGDLTGIAIGGLGAGAGQGFTGLGIGGLGVGGGGDGKGIIVGGLGAGFGGSFTGIAVGGLGVGAGDDATGVFIAGLGVGSGATLTGIAAGIVGVGAPRVRGLAVAGVGVGGHDLKGLMLSGITVRTSRDGSATGAIVSPVNLVRGHQKGLSVGVINYAWSLSGVQFGLLNIVRVGSPGTELEFAL